VNRKDKVIVVEHFRSRSNSWRYLRRLR